MAVLCGNAAETCYTKYGSVSIRGKNCHEIALRIVLQCIESHANRYGRYIVSSFFKNHNNQNMDMIVKFLPLGTSRFTKYRFLLSGICKNIYQPKEVQRNNKQTG